jgi:hypothetical protein
MSALTSSVPGTFAALYNLLVAAGQTENPQVSVFAQSIQQNEPNSYVLLGGSPDGVQPGIRNHQFAPASLGSLNQYETYEIWGYASVYDGNFDPEGRLSDTWALYQNLVMNTYINYSGGNGSIGGPGSQILGSQAPVSLEQVLPLHAEYVGVPVSGGFAGVLEFGYEFKARITVT